MVVFQPVPSRFFGTGPLFPKSAIPKVMVGGRVRVSRVRFRVSRVMVRFRVRVGGPSV